jgi:hypothetical protein
MSAALAGGAAIAIAILEASAVSPARRSVLVMAAALLLLALLVRPMAATAGALGMAIALLPLAAAADFSRRRRLALLGIVGLAIGLSSAAVLFVDAVAYGADPGWADYHRYNWMFARLFEWGDGLSEAQVDAVRASVQWSPNDWAMLNRWWGVDPQIHGIDRVTKAYDATAAVAGGDGWLASVRAPLDALGRADPRRIATASVPVLAASVAVLGAFANLRGALAGLFVLGLFGAFCMGVEAAFKELPFRLLAPLQAIPLTAVVVTAGAMSRRASVVLPLIALSIALAIAADHVVDIVREARADRGTAAELHREVAAVAALKPSLVIRHADSFPSERWWRPFQRPSIDLVTIPVAENNQSPLLQRFLSVTDRQPLVRAMCADPSILVISEPGRLALATTYYREHLGGEMTWARVFDGSFDAWRCAPVR